ncbi:hypothetical protein JW859_13050 [bacterium]|nr:hypothetical protein [bacterium]
MGFNRTLLVMAATILLLSTPAFADTAQVLEIAAEFSAMATGDYWPGYDPLAYPLAIYNCADTYLFRHPNPPEDFVPCTDHPEISVFSGRYPAVTANSSAEIGGVITGTLTLDATGAAGPRALAAVAVHELYHVFQGEHHPSWGANVANRLTYPDTDAGLLAAKRLETLALEEALAAVNFAEVLGWVQAALELRRQRFATMAPEHIEYEQRMEVHEGTAAYIQTKAEGLPHSVVRPAGGDYGPADVRRQAYYSGSLIALLLDRCRLGWREELEADDTLFIDDLLADTVADSEVPPKEFPPFVTDETAANARADIAAHLAGLAEQRAAFDAVPGQSVVIVAAGDILFPNAIDPMNMLRLSDEEVLHTRWLKLGNQSGYFEALNYQVLTCAAGGHPLFNGVTKAIVRGLDELEINTEDSTVIISATDFELSFSGATVDQTDRGQVVVSLGQT